MRGKSCSRSSSSPPRPSGKYTSSTAKCHPAAPTLHFFLSERAQRSPASILTQSRSPARFRPHITAAPRSRRSSQEDGLCLSRLHRHHLRTALAAVVGKTPARISHRRSHPDGRKCSTMVQHPETPHAVVADRHRHRALSFKLADDLEPPPATANARRRSAVGCGLTAPERRLGSERRPGVFARHHQTATHRPASPVVADMGNPSAQLALSGVLSRMRIAADSCQRKLTPGWVPRWLAAMADYAQYTKIQPIPELLFGRILGIVLVMQPSSRLSWPSGVCAAAWPSHPNSASPSAWRSPPLLHCSQGSGP